MRFYGNETGVSIGGERAQLACPVDLPLDDLLHAPVLGASCVLKMYMAHEATYVPVSFRERFISCAEGVSRIPVHGQSGLIHRADQVRCPGAGISPKAFLVFKHEL